MSWLFSTPTEDQAQAVVCALQDELEERQRHIVELEKALKDEKDFHQKVLMEEINGLELRKALLKAELKEICQIIEEKKVKIHDGNQVLFDHSEQVEEEHQDGEEDDESDDGDMVDARCIIYELCMSNFHTRFRSDFEELSFPAHPELAKVLKFNPNVVVIIQRSQNSNTVIYAMNKDDDNEIDTTNPVDVYWIMYEKPNNPREELNMIERNSAYGVSICDDQNGRNGHYTLTLASLKDRKLDLFISNVGPVVETTIDKQPQMRLQRVFVKCVTSWGIPRVEYIELFGYNPSTGKDVYEKKMNK